jgi:hypothetical protein
MGAVEDVRKLLQDIVTPDLKAIEAQVHALDKKIDLTRDLLLAELKTLATIVAANHATLTHALDIDRRLERIENERAARVHEVALERTA